MSSVYPKGAKVERYADLSSDGTYRYWLGRRWEGTGETLRFIMLNPSTADAAEDDQTIRKCVGFARRLGYSGIGVMNLYAYRATDPADLRRAMRAGVDVVGPDNDGRLRTLLRGSLVAGSGVVAAWGAHAPESRVREVLAMEGSRALCTLGLTAEGFPRHPLMLGYEGATLSPMIGNPVESSSTFDSWCWERPGNAGGLYYNRPEILIRCARIFGGKVTRTHGLVTESHALFTRGEADGSN